MAAAPSLPDDKALDRRSAGEVLLRPVRPMAEAFDHIGPVGREPGSPIVSDRQVEQLQDPAPQPFAVAFRGYEGQPTRARPAGMNAPGGRQIGASGGRPDPVAGHGPHTPVGRAEDNVFATQGPARPEAPASPTPAMGAEALSRQIAEPVRALLQRGPGGEVSVHLAPSELGRVTVMAQRLDDGIQLVLQADRPETLDMFRRHADQLSQDLARSSGGPVNLSFAGSGGQAGGHRPGMFAAPHTPDAGAAPQSDPPPAGQPPAAPSTGMNMLL